MTHKNKSHSRYEIVTPKPLVIRDIGPWDKNMTVTDDIKNVVEKLVADGNIGQDGKFMYLNPVGETYFAFVEKGKFSNFSPAKMPDNAHKVVLGIIFKKAKEGYMKCSSAGEACLKLQEILELVAGVMNEDDRFIALCEQCET